MTREQLVQHIFAKKSYLCVGLDTDIDKIPEYLRFKPAAVLDFNKQIIDATKDVCVAYKLNTAFYEALGSTGWNIMEETVNYIPSTHFKIADAKRGDIGNTSSQYAKAFFEKLRFDAITVTPYMGEDSIRPFLQHADKWTIVLALTSNAGAEDFELQKIEIDLEDFHEEVHTHKKQTDYLYEIVIKKVSKWGTKQNLMFVVGATKAGDISSIRKIIPDNFLLVPGVGAQGGSLKDVSEAGLTKDCGLLVNISRAIIYAGPDENFATAARINAQQYQQQMETLLKQANKLS